jgi:hypothetical protein
MVKNVFESAHVGQLDYSLGHAILRTQNQNSQNNGYSR